jgi:hypothetical protein
LGAHGGGRDFTSRITPAEQVLLKQKRRFSSTAHNNQPSPLTMDDFDYLDSLSGRRQMLPRGNHARDSPDNEGNEGNEDNRFDMNQRIMAATPPSFRTRSNTALRGSHSSTAADTRNAYWINTHQVNI